MLNIKPYNNYINESNIVIKNTEEKGRGVFAAKTFNEGDVIEICPIIIIPSSDKVKIFATVLGQYVFEWKSDLALALGNGSLYNHDNVYYNARHENNYSNNTIIFYAENKILNGTEILFNYGWE